MQEVFNFLLEHWQVVVYVLISCLSIIFSLIRKRPIKLGDYIKNIICSVLPSCINYAENTIGLKGVDKKKAALDFLFQYLVCEGLGSYQDLFDEYYDFASNCLEDILTTPHKKGE